MLFDTSPFKPKMWRGTTVPALSDGADEDAICKVAGGNAKLRPVSVDVYQGPVSIFAPYHSGVADKHAMYAAV